MRELVATWEVTPYIYQVWEDDAEFSCVAFHKDYFETLFVGRGNTSQEAIEDGIRQALGVS